MKKTGLFAVAALMTLTACSSMSVQTDYAVEADFSQFETFRYQASDRSVATVAPLADERIVAAIRREMIASGLTESESDADVIVTYYATVDEQLQFSTVYTGVNAWGRRGWGGMGVSSASTRATTFQEGTLVIDIIDAETKNLVWRGIGQKVVDQTQDSPEKIQEKLDQIINKIMASFPPE